MGGNNGWRDGAMVLCLGDIRNGRVGERTTAYLAGERRVFLGRKRRRRWYVPRSHARIARAPCGAAAAPTPHTLPPLG
jgi:hypothetical protein